MVHETAADVEVDAPRGAIEVAPVQRSQESARRARDALQTHPNLKEKAAAYIRSEILEGHLRAGEKVDQDAIAEALGMSRLPVREALIELTQEGLVDAIARRGSFVARITQDDIRDQYRIQGMVAGIAAGRAAIKLSDEQLGRLRALHDEFMMTNDSQEHAEISRAFHAIVVETGSSNRLLSILRLLFRSLPTDYFDLTAAQRERISASRTRLLKALEARDSAGAAAVQAQLWIETGEMTIELLGARGLWDSTDE